MLHHHLTCTDTGRDLPTSWQQHSWLLGYIHQISLSYFPWFSSFSNEDSLMILACPVSFQTLSFSSLFYITDIPTCHTPYSSQSQQFLTANSCISPRLMLSLVAWHPLVSLCSRSAACLVSYRTQCPLPVLPDVLCRTVIQGILLRYYTVLKPAITSSASSLTPGCHLSCTRISFAFKMSTPSPRQASGFSLCPSPPWHVIPPGSRYIPRRR